MQYTRRSPMGSQQSADGRRPYNGVKTVPAKSKPKINSRAKGARGELELAHYLSDRGYEARRGQQFSGSPDSPDVVCKPLERLHIECKFVEQLNLYNAVAQAAQDAGDDQVPICIHRRKRTDWHVTLTLDDFLGLLEARHDFSVGRGQQCPVCDSFQSEPAEHVSSLGHPNMKWWSCKVCLNKWGVGYG